jgi:Tol biopolymer transport system component
MLTWRAGVAVVLLTTLGSAANSSHAGPTSPAAASRASAAPLRILYSGDWTGTSQVYAVDAAQPRAMAQLTFGRRRDCVGDLFCGYLNPAPSPDGTYVALSFVPRSCSSQLFVVRSDGRGPFRPIRRSPATCGDVVSMAWAPDSRQIAYVARDGLHVVRRDGTRDRLISHDKIAADGLSWSRDGRVLAYRLVGGNDYYRDGAAFVVIRNGGNRIVAPRSFDATMAPDGRRVAYRAVSDNGVRVVDVSGAHDHAVGVSGYPVWSASGRWLAVTRYRDDGPGVVIVDTATGARRNFGSVRATGPVWAPRGSLFAFSDNAAIWLGDARTGQARQLSTGPARLGTLTWSPSANAVAYLAPTIGNSRGAGLRVVTLAGRDELLVRTNGRYGGALGATFAWLRPPATARFRQPEERSIATVGSDGVTAKWAVTSLAADGDRVAFVSCGHVFVWNPAARTVDQVDPATSGSPHCSRPNEYLAEWVYSLALAGDRVAYAWASGNMGRSWRIWTTAAWSEQPTFELEYELGAAGGISGFGLGDLLGSGDLLVYSRWRERLGPFFPAQLTQQTVVRVDGNACPCPALATEDGPYTPFDVDDGRILVGGTNELRLLDRDGYRLLSLDVKADAAALDDRDIAAVVRGSLRHYDASSGTLLHTWPLPDVPAGFRCGSPSGYRCPQVQLVFDDLAQGLAAYVLDGQVHILRLADGIDRTVGTGSAARFMNAGLVYADQERLRLVRYAELPTRTQSSR